MVSRPLSNTFFYVPPIHLRDIPERMAFDDDGRTLFVGQKPFISDLLAGLQKHLPVTRIFQASGSDFLPTVDGASHRAILRD